jgi:nitroreductase
MEILDALIGRASPLKLVEPAPSEAALERILAAAVRAPDHGRLRPWRLLLIRGEARRSLGVVLGDALRRREAGISEAVIDRERQKPLRAPLIIVVAATPRSHSKVPEIEQTVAAAAGAENLIIAAHALGFGCFWRTGPAAYDLGVKTALGLVEQDQILGFLYVGTVGQPGVGRPPEIENTVSEWRG